VAISRPLALLGILAALALSACDEDGEPATTAAAPTAEAADEATKGGGNGQARGEGKPDDEAEAAPGTEVELAESQFGPILFDGSGQAIYLFDEETSTKPDCYGDCAAAWPPVLTEGEPVAGAGADAKLLGTTKREDGSTQLTYGGHPLYYYAHEGPGEVLCHGVDEFGGLWLVVDGAGEALPA
jgi:predicted lipoprotein with Yx(FWY)xxD motif